MSLSLSVHETRGSLVLSAEVVSSSPTKAPKWIKDGKELRLNKDPKKYLEHNHLPAKPSITIFGLEKADEGMYRVLVENEHGPGISEWKSFDIPNRKSSIQFASLYDFYM